MEQKDITKLTRRGIREPRPVSGGVNDDEITSMTLQGVNHLGMLIKRLDPSYYNERKSLSSNTHLFTKPSDCLSILNVWNLNTNAVSVTNASAATPIVITTSTLKTITDATNADPIVITSAAHGYETGDSIFISGVLGNTNANGTFTITKVDDNSFSLDESEGNAAYTSGGFAVDSDLAHGISDNGIAVVHDVVGNTDANGTWKATKASLVNGTDDKLYKCIAAHTAAAANRPITGANYAIYWEEESSSKGDKTWISGSSYVLSDYNLSLDGSVGNAAWTSSGKIYEDPKRPHKFDKKLLQEANLSSANEWYPRGNYIVIDDKEFSDDILIDYIKSPSVITDIPAEYHMGLVAWNVVNLIRIPPQEDAKYFDFTKAYQFNSDMLRKIAEDIQLSFEVSTEPDKIPQGINYEDYL